MPKPNLIWKKKPDADDYAAALNFLSLVLTPHECTSLVRALHTAKTTERTAKDLLRASNLPRLSRDDPHVNDDLKKVHKGKPLSPVLLVRGDAKKGIPLLVADGYHRICAVCYYDENAPIACRLVGK